jgi:hypothetical protein
MTDLQCYIAPVVHDLAVWTRRPLKSVMLPRSMELSMIMFNFLIRGSPEAGFP